MSEKTQTISPVGTECAYSGVSGPCARVVDGLAAQPGQCLRQLLSSKFGLSCPDTVVSAGSLADYLARTEMSLPGGVALEVDLYGVDHPYNHVRLSRGHPTWLSSALGGPYAVSPVSPPSVGALEECHKGIRLQMDMTEFLGWDFLAKFVLYANGSTSGDGGTGGFGGMFTGDVRAPVDVPLPGSTKGTPPPAPPRSVVEENVSSGNANVTGGVVRPSRRVIAARSTAAYGQRAAVKSYRTSGHVAFNNLDELLPDRVSRQLAQEVLEYVYQGWGLPMDQDEAMKYAEDVTWAFLIAATASDKADYSRVVEIPVRPFDVNGLRVEVVEADFKVLSDALMGRFNITRRQLCRAVADDLRRYITSPGNEHLLPMLATRVGCDPQLASLAFDGSTHCTGLNPRELAFVKTLESRNLFENEAVLAEGASARMLSGGSIGTPRLR